MPDFINKRLGKYRILEEVGRGGMGTVYKAWDSSRKRHVALKVLPAYFVHDELFADRFRRESQSVAALRHPHIVQLLEAGEHQHTLFMAMQYVDGGTLKELVQEEAPLPPEACLSIVEQVAEALDFAHEQGFVHRDVKPTNILLTSKGDAILTDFGIAKAAAGTSLTRTGLGMGTPEYMSPEQSQGRDVDGRSDVYSLGIVLYEMLTGQVPFKAETPLVVLHHHVYEAPTPPRQKNSTVPVRVEQVVLKALAKRPAERYRTASSLAEALRRAVQEVEADTIVRIPGLEEAEATVVVTAAIDEASVHPLYHRALAAFEGEDWVAAIDLFTQVLAVAGHYKETLARLTEASKQKRAGMLLAEAGQAVEKAEWTSAINLCVEVLSVQPNHETAQALLRSARRAQNLQSLYAQAREELAREAPATAARYLERLVELDPDYRDAQLLLAGVRGGPERQRIVAELLARGELLLLNEDWQSAADSFLSVLSVEPEHREARERLRQAEAGLAQAGALASLYREGVQHLEGASWPEAIRVLTQLLDLHPAYLDAPELLSQARRDQEKSYGAAKRLAEAEVPGKTPAKLAVEVPTQKVLRRRLSTAVIVGIAAAGLVLILVGYLAVSSARGRRPSISGGAASQTGIPLGAISGEATPSPEYQAEEIMSLTAESMSNLQSFSFQFETTGMTIYLEGDVPTTLRGAEGKVLRPASVDMQASVKLGPIPVPIRIIAVGPDTWFGDPTGTAWTKGPWALDLSSFFGQGGLLDKLWEMEDMRLMGVEEVGGNPGYHLTAEIEEDISQLQETGIVADAHVELWTDATAFHVRRLNLTGTGRGGEAISWTMNLDNFNQAVVVQPPEGTGIQGTPQPTPTATPAGMRLFDGLDSPGYWRNTIDPVSEWYYAEGEYHGRLTTEQQCAWKSRGDYGDFRVEVDVAAHSLQGAAGVVFRSQGDNELFYLFLIDANGHYALKSYESRAGWENLVDWQLAPALRTEDAQNHLEAICLGDSIALFANEQYLTTVENPLSSHGKLGPVVSSFVGDTDVHWSFDNFSIWEAPSALPDEGVDVSATGQAETQPPTAAHEFSFATRVQ